TLRSQFSVNSCEVVAALVVSVRTAVDMNTPPARTSTRGNTRLENPHPPPRVADGHAGGKLRARDQRTGSSESGVSGTPICEQNRVNPTAARPEGLEHHAAL